MRKKYLKNRKIWHFSLCPLECSSTIFPAPARCMWWSLSTFTPSAFPMFRCLFGQFPFGLPARRWVEMGCSETEMGLGLAMVLRHSPGHQIVFFCAFFFFGHTAYFCSSSYCTLLVLTEFRGTSALRKT